MSPSDPYDAFLDCLSKFTLSNFETAIVNVFKFHSWAFQLRIRSVSAAKFATIQFTADLLRILTYPIEVIWENPQHYLQHTLIIFQFSLRLVLSFSSLLNGKSSYILGISCTILLFNKADMPFRTFGKLGGNPCGSCNGGYTGHHPAFVVTSMTKLIFNSFYRRHFKTLYLL